LKISTPAIKNDPGFTAFSLNDLGDSPELKKPFKSVRIAEPAGGEDAPFSANDLDKPANENTIFN